MMMSGSFQPSERGVVDRVMMVQWQRGNKNVPEAEGERYERYGNVEHLGVLSQE